MPKKKIAMSTIGILHSGTNNRKHDKQIKAFIASLAKAGYSAPKNLTVVGPLWSDDDAAILADNAKTLASANPPLNLIVAAGGSASAYAAQHVTRTNGIPVVFTSFSQLASPAINMTGVDARTSELDPNRLGQLYDLVSPQWPDQKTFGVLENRSRKDYDPAKLDDAAAQLGIKLDRRSVAPGAHKATIIDTINQAFQSWQQKGIKVALVAADPLFNDLRVDVIAAEKACGVASMHQWHEFQSDGGYASYGTNLTQAYQMAGAMAGKVLKGIAPRNIPVQPLTTIGLSINRAAAKRFGLKVRS